MADTGRTVRGLVVATHAPPTVTVTVVMTALAASVGRGVGGSLLVAAAVLTGQLSVGWSNDYLDRHRDAQTGRPDKPVSSGQLAPSLVLRCAVVAAIFCVPLSLANGWLAGSLHLLGVAAAWAYNLGLKATPFSPVPYAIGFGVLPAFVVLGLPGHPAPPVWLVAVGSLLGLGAHFANVLPDMDEDLATGVIGLPHRIGRTASAATSACLLLAASVVLAVGPSDGPVWLAATGLLAALVLVAFGAAVSVLRPEQRSVSMFRVALALAVLDVALLLVRGGGLR
jgi:4-hydroxybenzoate polyprenyltransferase